MTPSLSPSLAMARSTSAIPRFSKEDITSQVKDRLSARLDKTVYVKSDARAKYGDVVAVVDEIRSAGVGSAWFAHRENQKEKQLLLRRRRIEDRRDCCTVRLLIFCGAPDPTRRGFTAC